MREERGIYLRMVRRKVFVHTLGLDGRGEEKRRKVGENRVGRGGVEKKKRMVKEVWKNGN